MENCSNRMRPSARRKLEMDKLRKELRRKLEMDKLRKEREKQFRTIFFACIAGLISVLVAAVLIFAASGCSSFQAVTQNPNSKYVVCESVCASAMAACRSVDPVDSGVAVVYDLDAGVPMVDDLVAPDESRTIGNLDGVVETVDTILGRLDSLDDCMARCGEVYDVLLEGVEACSP